MTNEQMQRFHELVREAAKTERAKGDELANARTDELAESYAKGKASGYIQALSIFWKIANDEA